MGKQNQTTVLPVPRNYFHSFPCINFQQKSLFSILKKTSNDFPVIQRHHPNYRHHSRANHWKFQGHLHTIAMRVMKSTCLKHLNHRFLQSMSYGMLGCRTETSQRNLVSLNGWRKKNMISGRELWQFQDVEEWGTKLYDSMTLNQISQEESNTYGKHWQYSSDKSETHRNLHFQRAFTQELPFLLVP